MKHLLSVFLLTLTLIINYGCEGTAKVELQDPGATAKEVTVDIETPDPINNSNANSYSLIGGCSENGKDVIVNIGDIETIVKCRNSSWEVEQDVSNLADGEVEITADHSTAKKAKEITKKDTALPTVTLDNLPDIGNANKNSYTISGTCSDEGGTIAIEVGTLSTSTECIGFSYTKDLNVSSITDGSLTINVIHTDLGENSSELQSQNVSKNTSLPTVTISNIGNINDANKSSVNLNGGCSEEARPVNISVGAINDSPICTSGSWSTTINISSLADGVLTFTADHSDAFGNSANQASTQSSKDATPPSVSINVPNGINNINKTSYSLSGSCSENGRSITLMVGTISTNATCNGQSWNKIVNAQSLADGNITITANLDDAFGNTADEITANTTKDGTPPTVSINALASINSSNQSNFTVSGTCSEDGTNVTISVGAISLTQLCSSQAWSKTINLSSTNDGVVSIVADHMDAAGNSAVQASGSTSKDTILPTLSINSLNPISTVNQNSYTISGSCSENSRVVNIDIDSISTSAVCSSQQWSVNVNVSSLSDGDIDVTASHSDSYSNSIQSQLTINKDTTLPTVAISSAGPINLSNVATYTFSGSCSEDGQSVNIDFNGNSYSQVCSSQQWTQTIDASSASDGSISILVDHQDDVGNSATQASTSIVKDSTAPTVTISNLSDITSNNQSSFTLTGSCNEDGGTVTVTSGSFSETTNCSSSSYTITADVSILSDGPVTFTATHTDPAQNTSTPATQSATKATAIPTVGVNAPSFITSSNENSFDFTGSCSVNGEVVNISIDSVSASATCNTLIWSSTVDLSSLSDGTYSVSVTHTDSFGNTSLQASTNVTKDTTAPTVTITNTDSINATNESAYLLTGACSENSATVNIVFSGTDYTATCSSGSWATNIDASALSDGNIAVTADISDSAGNSATQATQTILKRTSIPTVAIDALTQINTSNVSVYNVSGDCSDNGEDVVISYGSNSTTTTCSNSSWSTSLNVSSIADGNVTITANHDDVYGNPATQATATTSKDSTAPTLTFNSLVAINNANKTSYNLSGSCSEDTGAVNITVGSLSTQTTCDSDSWSATLDVSSLNDGSISIGASHSDSASNTTSLSETIVKNIVVPTVAITGTPSNIISSNVSAYNLTGTCSANDSNVNVSISTVNVQTVCSSSTWSITTDLSTLSDGSVSIIASHSDAQGNSATQATASAVKHSTLPEVQIGDLELIQDSNRAAYTVSGTCSDNGQNVTLGFDGTNYTLTCTSQAWSRVFDLSSSTADTIPITADLTDTYGNQAIQAGAYARTFAVIETNVTGTGNEPDDFTSGGGTTTYTSQNFYIGLSGGSETLIGNCSSALNINLYNDQYQTYQADSDVSVTLIGAADGAFYTTNDCSGSSTSTITISQGTSSSQIYYKNDNSAGVFSLGVSATGFSSLANQGLLVTGGAATQFIMDSLADKSTDTETTVIIKAVDASSKKDMDYVGNVELVVSNGSQTITQILQTVGGETSYTIPSNMLGSVTFTISDNSNTDLNVGSSPMTINITAGVASLVNFQLASGSSSTLTSNGSDTTNLEARVYDKNYNLVQGETVILTIPTNGGTADNTTKQTDSNGKVNFTLTSSTTSGRYYYSAQTSGGVNSQVVTLNFEQDYCTGEKLTNTPFAGGNGRSISPFMICTAEQFNQISDNTEYLDKYFKIRKDIDFSSTALVPIGTSSSKFTGHFDGGGYLLSGISLSATSHYLAVFKATNAATITNINLSIGTISSPGYNYIAGLIAHATGTSISNVNIHINNKVEGNQYVAGAIGYMTTTQVHNLNVSGSTSIGSSDFHVDGTGNYVGGSIGYSNHNTSRLEYSKNSHLKVKGSAQVGGILGSYQLKLYGVSAHDITVSGSSSIGGIVGYFYAGEMVDSFVVGGNVTGTSNSIAGLVGYHYSSTVTNAYAAIEVTASTHSYNQCAIGYNRSGTVNGIIFSQSRCNLNSSNGYAYSDQQMLRRELYLFHNWDFSQTWVMPSSGGLPELQYNNPINAPAISSLFASGIGTESSPYVVNTADQLGNITYAMQLDENVKTSFIQLGQDIDLSASAAFPYIGNTSDIFAGVFDGNNNKILNINIIAKSNYVGLFPKLAAGSAVIDLILEANDIEAASNSYIGVLSGEATTTNISNVEIHLNGVIKGTSHVGGLIGSSSGSNYNNIRVFGKTGILDHEYHIIATGSYHGGIFGTASGSNFNLTKIYDIKIQGGGYVGGIIGNASSSNFYDSTVTDLDTITAGSRVGGIVGNCTNTCTFNRADINIVNTVSGTSYVGGAGGYTQYTSFINTNITGSSGLGSDEHHVLGTTDFVGGIMGYGQYGTSRITSSSVNNLKVQGRDYVGGLLGYYQTAIDQSFVTNSHISGRSSVGGLVGYYYVATMTDSFITGGSVTGTGTNIGGVVGYHDSSNTTNSYAATPVTASVSVYNQCGIGRLSSGSITGVIYSSTQCSLTSSNAHFATDSEMYNRELYLKYNWNYSQIWRMPNPAGYPILQREYPIQLPTVASLFSGGDGTPESPYLIDSTKEIGYINYAMQLNQNATTAHYKLTTNIDLSVGDVRPMIGNDTITFNGVFDGNGKTLFNHNLTPQLNYAGLFSRVGSGATIKNFTITIDNINAASRTYIGGVAGESNTATFSDIQVLLKGTIYGTSRVAGLVGSATNSTFKNIEVVGQVGYASDAYHIVATGSHHGGIVGTASGSTFESTSIQNLRLSGGGYVGGIIGSASSSNFYDTEVVYLDTITAGERVGGIVGSCTNTCTFNRADINIVNTVSGTSYVGGAGGYTQYTSFINTNITGSSGLGSDEHHVLGTTDFVGGIMGYGQYGTSRITSSSVNNLKVQGRDYVGGLLGYYQTAIDQSFVTNSHISGRSSVGGLVGYYYVATMTDSFITGGSVTGTGTNIGGVVGYHDSSNTTNSYAATPVTASVSVYNQCGIGRLSSGSITGVIYSSTQCSLTSSNAHFATDSEMYRRELFMYYNWDFLNTWRLPDASGYPILQRNNPHSIPTVASLFNGGDGSEATPYLVNSAEQLGNITFAMQLNSNVASSFFKLTSNIDLSSSVYIPTIGNSENAFTGVFDGNNNTISNLEITPQLNYAGLFSKVGTGGVIKNLNLNINNINAASRTYIGGVAGESTSATFSNINVTLNGTIYGTSRVAGLVGSATNSTFEDITVVGQTGYASDAYHIVATGSYHGGIVGTASGSTFESPTTQNLRLSGGGYVGGIIGNASSSNFYDTTVTDLDTITAGSRVGGIVGSCTNTCTFNRADINIVNTVSGTSYVGGAGGYTQYTSFINTNITGSSGLGSDEHHVLGTTDFVGGIMGYGQYGTSRITSSSVNNLKVQGRDYVGGLLGYYQTAIDQSFVTNSHISGRSSVGGLVGYYYAATMTDSFVTGGSVTGTGTNIGGVVGYHDSSNTTNSYAATPVTASVSVYNQCGIGRLSSGSITGVIYSSTQCSLTSSNAHFATDSEMYRRELFMYYNWDFLNTWRLPDASGYPILQRNNPHSIPTVASLFNGGDGSEATPYLVNSAEQLGNITFAMQLNSNVASSFFKLTSNIDLSSSVYIPTIGNSENAFTGVFDGNNNTISNLEITPQLNYAGLFSKVGTGGVIKNLNLNINNINAASRTYIGGVAGESTSATFSNINVTLNGTIYGTSRVAGLVGSATNSTFEDITVVGQTGYASDAYHIVATGSYHGGIVGTASGSTFESPTTQNLRLSGGGYVGGIIGSASSSNFYDTTVTDLDTITAGSRVGGIVGNCTNTCTFNRADINIVNTVSGTSYVGGAGGYTQYTSFINTNITGSSGLGSDEHHVLGTTDFVGGIMGYGQYGTSRITSSSVNNLKVQGRDYVGGLLGYYQTAIDQSFVTNSHISGRSSVGGLVGYYYVATMTDSFITGGSVTGTGTNIGGVVGYHDSSNTTNSYAATPVTASVSVYNQCGIGRLSSGSITGVIYSSTQCSLTSSNAIASSDTGMYTREMFIQYGWNFASTWRLPETSGYPILQRTNPIDPPAISSLFAGGFGTSNMPYVISSSQELANINYAIQLNSNVNSSYFELSSNLDLSGNTIPLSIGSSSTPFEGIFNGNDKTISNLTINAGAGYVGLFPKISNAEVKNLNLTISGINATGFSYVGGLVGESTNSTVSNIIITIDGPINGSQRVAAVIGSATSTTLQNVHVIGSSSLATEQNHINASSNYSGGLIGATSNTLIEFSTVKDIRLSGASYTGGIVGSGGVNIYESYAQNNTISGAQYVGGIIGYLSSSNLKYSYNLGGSVTGTSTYVGGLIGYQNNSNSVQNFVATPVTASSSYRGCFSGRQVGGTMSASFFSSTQCTLGGVATTATDTEMTGQALYQGASWDTYYWLLNDGDYPSHQWEVP